MRVVRCAKGVSRQEGVWSEFAFQARADLRGATGIKRADNCF